MPDLVPDTVTATFTADVPTVYVAGRWLTIREGMRVRLATISGLQTYAEMPDKLVDSDAAVVLPGDPLFEPTAHSLLMDVNIRVVVRVARATAMDAQSQLDDYLWPSGTNSIVAAVEGGRTLGGAVDDCMFLRVVNYGVPDNTAGAMQADLIFRAKVMR